MIFVERVPVACAHQEIKGAWDDPRFVDNHTPDRFATADDIARINLCRESEVDVSDPEVASAPSEHLDTFGEDTRRADKLGDEIRAMPPV